MKKSTVFFALMMGTALIVTSGCKHGQINSGTIPGTTRIPTAGNPGENTADKNNSGTLPQPEGPTTITAQPEQPTNTGFPITDDAKWASAFGGIPNHDILAADTVYFDTDASSIKPSEQSKLEAIAAYFKNSKTDALMVEGYCDERGTEGYNMSLGDRRALAIREYLINLGVESGRIHTVSFGEAKPADAGHNEEAWHKNRRGVPVVMQPKQ